MGWNGLYCVFVLILKFFPSESFILIAPEDVSTGLAAIYGFTPKIVKGNDHRVGFGFKFGNHADFQVLYEFGPQELTKPLKPPIRIRSASYRQRVIRRRPFIEFLIKAGLLDLKDEQHEIQVESGGGYGGYEYDEPR